MKWFEKWREKRHETQKLRIEKGSIPRVWLGTLAIAVVLLAVAIFSAAWMITHALDAVGEGSKAYATALGGVGQSISVGVAQILTESPEVGMAGIAAAANYDGDDTAKLVLSFIN